MTQKINWLQVVSVVGSIGAMILGAMFWVNTQITTLKVQMESVQHSDFKTDLKELHELTHAELSRIDNKIDDNEKAHNDRHQRMWDVIGKKRDK